MKEKEEEEEVCPMHANGLRDNKNNCSGQNTNKLGRVYGVYNVIAATFLESQGEVCCAYISYSCF